MIYTVHRTRDFDRSYQRCLRSGHINARIKTEIEKTVDELAAGKKLSANRRDHQLKGDLGLYRECHIKGDLLLVYQIQKEKLVLVLVDIGSHSYLGI